MATKRGAPATSQDSRRHWKRHKPNAFQRQHPANHGKTSYKKAHAVNDLKKTVRSISRLLDNSTNLPATVRVEKERQLQTAQHELANATKAKKRSATIGKYHKMRFFERRKAERRLKQARKALKEAGGKDEQARWREKVAECEVDVNYALYAPLEWDYVPLFPTRRRQEGEAEGEGGGNGGEVERLGDREMWERVKICMEEGTLGDLREGRLEEGGEDGVEEEPRNVKKVKAAKKKDGRTQGKKEVVEQKDEDESGDESGGGFFE